MSDMKQSEFYPFGGFHSRISAYVEPPTPWSSHKETKYSVSWPSIGSTSVGDTRKFAATLKQACDWLDAQKAAAGPSTLADDIDAMRQACVNVKPQASEPDPDHRALLVEAAEALKQGLTLDPTCDHTDTHRGGAIWTICDSCGKAWADDQGGFRPDPPNKAIEAMLTTLARIRAALEGKNA